MIDAGPRQQWPLYALAGAAVAVGLYARFKNLHAAPLAVDEFFIVRSVENVLQHGVPRFDCGGYYTRGLLLQYLAALLQLLGISGEIAPRLISAVSSVLALPAVYILGCHVQGRTLGLIAVTVLALSVWEVEMGRFGRMYAPFQAVFLWYLVFLIRYTVDRQPKALWAMLGLTVVGPLVWEGGALVAAANLLVPFLLRPSGRLTRGDGRYLLVMAALFALSYWFATTDFRIVQADNPWPPGYDPSQAHFLGSALDGNPMPLTLLPAHPGWLLLFAIPFGISLLAVRWVWAQRDRPLVVAGLVVALGAALVHQFLVVGAALALLLILRSMRWQDLFQRASAPFHLSIGTCAVFWLIVAALTFDWGDPRLTVPWHKIAVFVYPFVGFPDFASVIALPWAGAVPILSMVLVVLLSATALHLIIEQEPKLSSERVLFAALVCLLLAASLGHPPRYETRYVFFLYPVAVLLALGMLLRGGQSLARDVKPAGALSVPVILGGFALTEDFNLAHLLAVDKPAEIFRAGLTEKQESHLVRRADSRAIARWLQQNTHPGADVVVSAYQSLDYYYPHLDFFFVDRSDFNLMSYACRHGTIDRWSNLRLLYTVDGLSQLIRSARRTVLVTYARRLDELPSHIAQRRARVAWKSEDIAIVVFEPS